MKIGFILIATGHIMTPRVNHAIFTLGDIERVKAEAKEVVSVLAATGKYYSFELFDVREETHVCIARFNIEMPEPIVTIK